LRVLLADYAEVGGIYEVRAYYGNREISDSDALPEFFEVGGILLLERTPTGGGTARDRVKAYGDRATLVSVGTFDAVLTWSDALYGSESIRPFNLWMNDGEYDVKIVGATDTPEAVVDFARSMYC
jgi:hypothetical protein